MVKQEWDFREVLLGRRATVDAATEFLASIAVYRSRKTTDPRGSLPSVTRFPPKFVSKIAMAEK